MFRLTARCLLPLLLALGSDPALLSADEPAQPAEVDADAKPKPTVLLNGKDLKGWKVTNFGGQGEVTAEEGVTTLNFGNDLTGLTYAGKVPTTNYELNLKAKRVDGNDFFCGLTFPVGEGHCSLILGGWGGGVVGLSSIDEYDASENETTQFTAFDQNKWYAVRVRVTDKQVECFLDGKSIIDVDRKGKKFTTRIEMDLSKPLGIASFQTTAAIKNFTLTKLRGKRGEPVQRNFDADPKPETDTTPKPEPTSAPDPSR